MTIWYDLIKIRHANLLHDRRYGPSALYVEPFVPPRAIRAGKLCAGGNESLSAIPVILSKSFDVGDYIIFVNNGPIVASSTELHGWISKIITVNDDNIVTSPEVGTLDGTILIHQPSMMVGKDFFLIARTYPELAGWEKPAKSAEVIAERCPQCGKPTTYFRMARFCPVCQIVERTDTWGKHLTWESML